MGQAWVPRAVAKVLIAVPLVGIGLTNSPAQSADDIAALNQQVEQLYGQEKYGEAIPLAEKALVVAERTLGKEHPSALRGVNNLAELYRAQGGFGEAAPLLERASDGTVWPAA
jgi:Tetratricopeptide repeat